jgi:hypothetical protein
MLLQVGLVALVLGLPARAATPLELTGFEVRWLSTGQNNTTATPAEEWQRIEGPLQIPDTNRTGDELWLRITLPTLPFRSPAVHFDYMRDAAILYLDGAKIGTYNVPGDKMAHASKPIPLFELPADSPGKTLTLRITAQPRPFQTIRPNARFAFLGESRDLVQGLVRQGVPPAVIGLLACLTGVLFIVACLFGLRDTIFHWAGLFAIAIGLYLITRATIPELLGIRPTHIRRTELVSLYFSPAFGGAMLHRFYSPRLPQWLKHLSLFSTTYLMVFAATATLLSFREETFLVHFLYVFQISFLCAAVVHVVCSMFDVIRGNKAARFLLTGIVLTFAISSLDVVNSMRASRYSNTTTTTHWGIGVLLVSVLLLLTRRAIALFKTERLQNLLLAGLLETTKEIERATTPHEILSKGANWLVNALSLPVNTNVHFIKCNPHAPTSESLGSEVQLRGSKALPHNLPPFSGVHSRQQVEREILWLLVEHNHSTAFLALHPFPNAALNPYEENAVGILAETLELSLNNLNSVDEMRRLHERQLEEQRTGLIRRLSMAAEISDRLNSPILVLSNTLKAIQQRFEALRHSEIRLLPQATQALLATWDKLSPHIDDSLDSMTTVSRRLSELREETGAPETTRILQRHSDEKKDS